MKAVNLLPTDQRSASKAKPATGPSNEPASAATGAFVVLGALALAVLATASYVLLGNTIKDRQAELARVQDDTQIVQAQLGALKPYADFQTVAAQRVATVTQLANGRFDWEQALRDLSRALPSQVRLKSLRGSVTTGIGGGSNAMRGSVAAPAVELSGCAPSQAHVARLMSRLRIVRGVTRVALSKSEKPAPAVAAAASASMGAEAKLCKGRAPAFEVVVFFERSAVVSPTAAAPGTTPPPATSGSTPPSTSTPPSGSATTAPASTSSTTPSTTGASAP